MAESDDEQSERIKEEIKSVSELRTVLFYLKDASDPVRPKELSNTVLGRNVYSLFRRLENMGLVETAIRRKKLTSYMLTEKGQKIVALLEEEGAVDKEKVPPVEVGSPFTASALGFLGAVEDEEKDDEEVNVVFGMLPCAVFVKKHKIIKLQSFPLVIPIPRDWFFDSEQAIRNFEKFIKSEEGKKFLENLEEVKEP